MEKRTTYFSTFWAPGSFVAENWTEDLPSADPASVEWPKNAYAFSLHQREDVIDGATVFKGTSVQLGPLYYHPDSRVETLEQVRANPKATKTLVSNMECNGWTHIVWSRWGNWPQPFDPAKDQVLGAPHEH